MIFVLILCCWFEGCVLWLWCFFLVLMEVIWLWCWWCFIWLGRMLLNCRMLFRMYFLVLNFVFGRKVVCVILICNWKICCVCLEFMNFLMGCWNIFVFLWFLWVIGCCCLLCWMNWRLVFICCCWCYWCGWLLRCWSVLIFGLLFILNCWCRFYVVKVLFCFVVLLNWMVLLLLRGWFWVVNIVMMMVKRMRFDCCGGLIWFL